MQCFKLIQKSEFDSVVYANEYNSKQLFKTSTVIIKIMYAQNGDPLGEYKIYVNNELFAVTSYYISHRDKVYYIKDGALQIGILDVKLGTVKSMAMNNELILKVHIFQEQLVVVTTTNVYVNQRLLANISGASCICNTYICIGTTQGITLFTINNKSHIIPLVGEKLDMISNGDYIYSSGKVGYIYDIKCRYNAYTGPLVGKWVKGSNNTIYLINNQDVHSLVEKDIYSKVELAIKKEMFELGILLVDQEPESSFNHFSSQVQVYSLSSSNKNSASNNRLFSKFELKSEIYKLFANNTYSNDKLKAMQYYIQTIHYLEPSVVILKYMNSTTIDPLMDYLEHLHTMNVANADHTTLLLNCYSKTRNIQRLDAFLKNSSEIVKFNPDVAIKCIREAGHIQQALDLCLRFKNNHQYCKILLEDANDDTKALQFIKSLELTQSLELIQVHGRALIDAIPYETTEYFKSLTSQVPPEMFLPFYCKEFKYCTDFLLYVVKHCKLVGSKIWTSLFEVALQTPTSSPLLLEILEDPNANIDECQVLLLCHVHGFAKGKLVLLKRMKLHQEIIKVYQDLKDKEMVLKTAMTYGNKETWIDLLEWFMADPNYLQKALHFIEGSDILTAVEVVQILSKNEENTIEMIRDYLKRQFSKQKQQITEYQAIGDQFKQEINLMEMDIKKIRNEPILFKETQCSACLQLLNLPIIHFYCKHSYHSSCLGDSEECPKCIEEYALPLMEVGEGEFYDELDRAEDSFAKMTEYFSRHLISTTPMLNN